MNLKDMNKEQVQVHFQLIQILLESIATEDTLGMLVLLVRDDGEVTAGGSIPMDKAPEIFRLAAEGLLKRSASRNN